MARAMTYDELMQYAKENYTKGGDGVFECWDEQVFDDYVKEFGEITKAKARQIFRIQKEITDDQMGW